MKQQLFLLLVLQTSLFAAKTADTKFSIDRGFYDSPIEITITTATPDAEIFYTLNGSSPTAKTGLRYTEPITVNNTTVIQAMAVKEGFTPSNVDAQTYIFLDQIIHQSEHPGGFPDSWLSKNGDSVRADYAMDPDYPDDDATLRQALAAIPTVSISLDPDHLFGSSGFYTNGGRNDNAAYEVPCSAEFIYSENPNRNFQINCGIQPRSHRLDRARKRGFKLDFKSQYGPSKLREPLFDGQPETDGKTADEFNSLIFRSGFFENYTALWYDPHLILYFRDILTRSAQLAAEGIGTRNLFIHLYLNGLYWGIYNISEVIDSDFLESYLGGDADSNEWLIVKSNSDSNDDGYLVSGSANRYYELLQLTTADDFAVPETYTRACQLIDPAAFADYIILQNYHAVGDWPDNNWVFVQRNGQIKEPGRFLIWDAEKTWLHENDPQSYKHAWYSPYLWNTSEDRFINKGLKTVPGRLWQAFIANPDFRMLFADRVFHHLFQEGALTNQSTLQRFDYWADQLTSAIRADQKRWSDFEERSTLPGFTFTHAHWQTEVNTVRQNIENNAAHFITALQEHQLYPGISPPLFNHPGGETASGVIVELSNPNETGSIYYTLSGHDPRLSEGRVSQEACSGNSLSFSLPPGTTTLKARIKDGSIWSPLQQATFYTPDNAQPLKITEIMYHPPELNGIDGDEFEFIEIKNTGSIPVNLSGMRITGGIDYPFEGDFYLDSQAFMILAENKDLFYEKYRIQPDGQYRGKLSNSGERITLMNALGTPHFTVSYSPDPPWPSQADGGGHSLVPVSFDQNDDPDDAGNWRASLFPLGSPGQEDSNQYVIPDPELPPPSLLFIVGKTDFEPEDQTVYSRLTGLGYAITAIDAKTMTLNDASGKSGIVISESIQSTDVGAAFRDIPIPVFLWEPYIYDDMDMTGDFENSDFGKSNFQTLHLSNTGHPMAAGLTGSVDVFTESEACSYGQPAASAQIIAHWQGHADKAAIFAYEKGSLMAGRQAPARRTGFFSNDGAADVTPEGWLLFDAAVQWTFEPALSAASIDRVVSMPADFSLGNFPNPFNMSTTLAFTLTQPAKIDLSVFDIRGRWIITAASGHYPAGCHTVPWHGFSDSDEPVSSGIYLYRLTIQSNQQIQTIQNKMLLVK